MNKINIYLAGTIYSDPLDISWKKRFINQLPSDIFTVYDPNPVKGSSFEVVPRDKRTIENCDFVVAYIRTPSFGTTMEIKHAFDCGNITTFVIDPTMKNINSLWLAYHIHGSFIDVDSCVTAVIKTVDKMKVIEP